MTGEHINHLNPLPHQGRPPGRTSTIHSPGVDFLWGAHHPGAGYDAEPPVPL